jgi:hypothetical protein
MKPRPRDFVALEASDQKWLWRDIRDTSNQAMAQYQVHRQFETRQGPRVRGLRGSQDLEDVEDSLSACPLSPLDEARFATRSTSPLRLSAGHGSSSGTVLFP